MSSTTPPPADGQDPPPGAGPAGGYGPPAHPPRDYGSPPAPPGSYGPASSSGPPASYGPPEGPPYAEPPSQPGRNRGLLLGIIGAVLALILGTAGFAAYRLLSGGGAQPAEALPGNALAYFRVDFDPSAGQKISAIRLLKKFPGFAEATGITDENVDLRRRAFELLQETNPDCAGLDYDDEVASWLGERAAVAILPPARGATDPGVVAAVQVSDQSAAEDGLRALSQCTGGEPVAYAPVGEDYLAFAETQALTDEYARAAEDSPLSENSAFTADMDRLGDQGVLSGWLSVETLVDHLPADSLPEGFDRDAMLGATSMATALRFDEQYLELAGVVSGAVTPADLPDNPVVNLPASTFAVVSVSGAGEQIDPAWEALGSLMASSGESIDVFADQVEQETGIVLPTDLATILGENLTLALDSEGLDFSALANSGDASDLRIGARFQTDVADFHAVLDKVEQYASSQGAELSLATVDGDGFVALSPNADYAQALAEDGGLGDSDAFVNAVPDANSAVAVLYADFDAVEEQVVEGLQSGGAPDEVIENIKPIASFGLASHIPEDGVFDFSLRLTVN